QADRVAGGDLHSRYEGVLNGVLVLGTPVPPLAGGVLPMQARPAMARGTFGLPCLAAQPQQGRVLVDVDSLYPRTLAAPSLRVVADGLVTNAHLVVGQPAAAGENA